MVVVEELGGYEFTGFHEMEKWKKESNKAYKKNAVFCTGRTLAEAYSLERNSGRSSKRASICEGRSQKPVGSSEQWMSSSEQVSGCGRSSKPCGARANEVRDVFAQTD